MNTLSLSHLPSAGMSSILAKASKLMSFAWIATLRTRFRQEMEMRAAIAELKMLDDHCLADIGVKRADIERAVRG